MDQQVGASPNSLVGSPKKTYTKSAKKTKAVRRLHFEDDKSSPVSGTIIRDIKDAITDAEKEELNSKYEETALGIQVSYTMH